MIKIINVLRNESLTKEIEVHDNVKDKNWEVMSDYHFGGYAKTTAELQSFAQNFYSNYKIPLDPIYNSKLFYAMHDLMKSNEIKKRANVLIINTGGYQGINAYDYVNDKPWIRDYK